MEEAGRRRFFFILGWAVAGVLLLLFLSSKYDISFHKKSDPGEALTSTPPAEASNPGPAAKKTKATSPAIPVQPRVLSTEELFQMASPAVILIEIYDEEGHKRGLGSGFAVSSDGSVVTNYHVIRGASRPTAKFGDGTFATVSGIV